MSWLQLLGALQTCLSYVLNDCLTSDVAEVAVAKLPCRRSLRRVFRASEATISLFGLRAILHSRRGVQTEKKCKLSN